MGQWNINFNMERFIVNIYKEYYLQVEYKSYIRFMY